MVWCVWCLERCRLVMGMGRQWETETQSRIEVWAGHSDQDEHLVIIRGKSKRSSSNVWLLQVWAGGSIDAAKVLTHWSETTCSLSRATTRRATAHETPASGTRLNRHRNPPFGSPRAPSRGTCRRSAHSKHSAAHRHRDPCVPNGRCPCIIRINPLQARPILSP